MCLTTSIPNRDRVYASHFDDTLGMEALTALHRMGAKTRILTGMHPCAEATDVCIFTSPQGTYCNKIARVLRDRNHARKEGFHIPNYVAASSEMPLIALSTAPYPFRDQGLQDLLRQVHFYHPDGWARPAQAAEALEGRKDGYLTPESV